MSVLTLVVAEHDNQSIKPATLNAIAASCRLDGEVHLLVAGASARPAADAAARITGVSKILLVDGKQLEHGLAEGVAAQVVAVAAAYSHIVLASTAWGKDIAPRVAALLDVAQISDVVNIIDPETFERPIYAGSVVATVRSADRVKVLTVRTTCFDPVSSEGGQAVVDTLVASDHDCKTHFVGSEITKSARPDLTSAQVIVAGGRALGSSEMFCRLLMPLADKLNGALGASRAAVDLGYAPNDWQVGQTGKIVSPQLYLAIGISGAIQHLAGMKDSKIIVAINKDAEAPIFSVANYGLEADLFDAVPELTALLPTDGHNTAR
jgi:electron transfer flavoprotein alpha subunit